MPFLNFGGNKNKHYEKVDPRIRIHFSQMWIQGFGSGSTSKWDGSETLIWTKPIALMIDLKSPMKINIRRRYLSCVVMISRDRIGSCLWRWPWRNGRGRRFSLFSNHGEINNTFVDQRKDLLEISTVFSKYIARPDAHIINFKWTPCVYLACIIRSD